MNNRINYLVGCLVASLLAFSLLLLFLSPATQASAATILVVDTLEDELNSDGDCSLREAITAANDNTAVDACPAGDSILTDTIIFKTAGTIPLTKQLSVTGGGPLLIDGGEVITISGGGSVRVLRVDLDTGDTVLNIQNIVIANGLAEWKGKGGGLHNAGRTIFISNTTFINNISQGHCDGPIDMFPGLGSGIANEGILHIKNSALLNNSRIGCVFGGGIFNTGVLTLDNSILKGNEANWGGGIWNNNNATALINDSTIIGNSAEDVQIGYGGGIFNYGLSVINNSIITGNSADSSGGGVANDGILTIINSTLSGNSSSSGGVIYNPYGALQVANTTIISNTAGLSSGSNATATVSNSIIAQNINGNCFGSVTSLGFNIAGDNSCNLNNVGDMNNTDPLLGPLQDNGGPTFTHMPLKGSPAIDGGNPFNCPNTDQRGFPRPVDGDGDGIAICDIGAVEFGSSPPPILIYLPVALKP